MSSAAKSRQRKAPAKAAKWQHKLPEAIPEGFEISDVRKQTWKIGSKIGSGGFGTVYYASDATKPKDNNYVIKVEYHENGPLFAEMHCYQKIAKPETLAAWIKQKKLKYLGLSPCHGFGSFEFNNSKYRFMVLERFDKDLQKILDENNHVFPLKSVCLIGLAVLDILEYIHSEGYIHGDIKAANLLLGLKKGTQNQVYLVDMGIACKYQRNGEHKQNLPDARKAHNGTPEFTSRDAHKGSFSRRSDLEMLCYNLLQWLCGQLPWEKYITDNNKIQKEKERLMDDIDGFLEILFPKAKCPDGIADLLTYVNELEFEQEPDYSYCKKLLMNELKKMGSSNDSTLVFKSSSKKTSVIPDSPTPKVSNKENTNKISKSGQVKRKIETSVEFEPGTVLTPAMMDVLKRKAESKPKSRKK